MRFFLLLLALAISDGDKTITKVVKLLQGMLDKSKEDGENDHEVNAAFKCYCDTNTDEKTEAIQTATEDIARMESFLADRRAMNTKLSQEIAQLRKDLDDNESARDEATTIRDKEHTDFIAEEADMVTAIAQMDRAIQALQAVGADQTQSSGADNEQLSAVDATAAAKAHLEDLARQDATTRAEQHLAGSLLAKKGKHDKKINVEDLDETLKAALRSASLFLKPGQKAELKAFIQAPGNYNAQSGEIVGVLKTMNDTFASNLDNARTEETKTQTDYEGFIAVKTAEHMDMTSTYEAKKVELGNNENDIATTQSELDTTVGIKNDDETFLGELTDRCAVKATEFAKRKMLRVNEEAAIAQAIAILHSDDARDTFGKTAATSSGASGPALFLQKRNVHAHHTGRKQLISQLTSKARALHSLRLAKVATAVSANNPFTEVLAMVRKMVETIDKEETDDQTKVAWCEIEQSTNNANLADKATDIGTLTSNIGNLQIVVTDTKANIEIAQSDLTDCRTAQSTETESRQAASAAFHENLGNLQEAEKILEKAVTVLEKYYKWLHASQAAHSYTVHEHTDSGGSNLKRITCSATSADACVDEYKTECSADPECVGFNSAGWLKSGLTEEAEWYDWEGGDLFVKTFAQTHEEAAAAFVQKQEPVALDHSDEPETMGAEMEGQRSQGHDVIQMLKFIQEETAKESSVAIDDERNAQSTYESTMNALTAQEGELKDAIVEYQQSLATTEKQVEETHEDLATTQQEHDAIEKYLAEILPHCTFYITKYEERRQGREAEKAALENALTLIEATPAFQNAVNAQEREDLGKCLNICDDAGHDYAKCLACQEDVTVFGYCAQNGSTPGCAEATESTASAALA